MDRKMMFKYKNEMVLIAALFALMAYGDKKIIMEQDFTIQSNNI